MKNILNNCFVLHIPAISKKRSFWVFACVLSAFYTDATAQIQPGSRHAHISGSLSDAPGYNLPVPKKARWFTDARLGSFIHWSPLSIRNMEIGWSWNDGVSAEEYIKTCRNFNPQHFNPDAWIKALKDGGIKYVVLVAKHHDGYCLWDTKATGFNTMTSPFHTDVCKAVKASCKKYGLKFCTYYSIADIYHNEWKEMCAVGGKEPPPVKGGMPAYLEFVKKQCGELMKKYGTEDFWFDGFWHKEWYDHPEYRQELARYLRSINQNVLLSRLEMPKGIKGLAWDDGWDFANNSGDYHSREEHGNNTYQKIYYEGPWEFCSSPTYPNYSYSDSMKYRTAADCIRQMVMIWGRNGNYLYNLGPRPDGSADPKQVDLLRQIGNWLKIYGRTVYGTQGGPYLPVADSFACTRKGNKIYLHILGKQTQIQVPALTQQFVSAHLLKNGKPLKFEKSKGIYTIYIPKQSVSDCDTVVELQATGPVGDEPLARLPVALK